MFHFILLNVALCLLSKEINYHKRIDLNSRVKEIFHISAIQKIQLKDKKIYIANGKTVFTNGRITMSSKSLTAFCNKKQELISLKAEGNIIIDPNNTQKAYADTAYYSIKKQIIVFTGNAKFSETDLNKILEGDTFIMHLKKNNNNKFIINRINLCKNNTIIIDKFYT